MAYSEITLDPCLWRDPEHVSIEILSSREHELIEHASNGLTDKRIAQQMGVSRSTVNSYWARIRFKLGQLSRTHLVSKVLKERTRRATADLQIRIDELEAALHRSTDGS